MKISKRRWFGIALVASALITWLVLVCFVYRARVLESHSYSDSKGFFSLTVTAHPDRVPAWIHFGMIGLVGFGIVLLLMPTRRQMDA